VTISFSNNILHHGISKSQPSEGRPSLEVLHAQEVQIFVQKNDLVSEINNVSHPRFEVSMAVKIQFEVLWVGTPCSVAAGYLDLNLHCCENLRSRKNVSSIEGFEYRER
jgi:hypothetical protein